MTAIQNSPASSSCGHGAYLFFVEPYVKSGECFQAVFASIEEGSSLVGRIGSLIAALLLLVPIINSIVYALLRVCEDEGVLFPHAAGRHVRYEPSIYQKRQAWLDLCKDGRKPEEVKALKETAFQLALQATVELARSRNAVDPETISPGGYDGIVNHLFFPIDSKIVDHEFYFTDEEIEDILKMIKEVVTQAPCILSKTRARRASAEAPLEIPYEAHKHLSEEQRRFLTTLTEPATACLYYRLQNAFNIHKSTEKYQDILRTKTFKHWNNPGEGNCFLWSCVIAIALSDGETFTPSQVRAKLDAPMTHLREQMVEEFRKKLKDPEFKREFITYLFGNEAFKQLLPQPDKEVLSAIASKKERHALRAQFRQDFQEKQCSCDNPEPTQGMIDGYIAMLESKGTWNGEFEAQLAVAVLKRPIVIFKNKRFFTIAGTEYLETGAKPIFVNHVGGCHWVTLDPYQA
jgi:hypothetical protein